MGFSIWIYVFGFSGCNGLIKNVKSCKKILLPNVQVVMVNFMVEIHCFWLEYEKNGKKNYKNFLWNYFLLSFSLPISLFFYFWPETGQAIKIPSRPIPSRGKMLGLSSYPFVLGQWRDICLFDLRDKKILSHWKAWLKTPLLSAPVLHLICSCLVGSRLLTSFMNLISSLRCSRTFREKSSEM